MSQAVVMSVTLRGIEPVPVRIEVDLLKRLPACAIVGLSESQGKETAERVRSAIESSGFEWPRLRIVVNAAPADIPKTAPLDLAIALGILVASGQADREVIDRILPVGELSLSGDIRPVRGGACYGEAASTLGRVLVGHPDVCREAAVVQPGEYLPLRTLREVIEAVEGMTLVDIDDTTVPADRRVSSIPPHLQDTVAAGVTAVDQGKPVLLVGRQGAGKTMVAKRISEHRVWTEGLRFDAAKIHSVCGLPIPEFPPFRAPHHTVTVAGLVGDRRLLPGEVALAHGGTLFLDEVQEFPRAAIDVVIPAYKNGSVRLLTRMLGSTEPTSVTMPSRFALVMAAIPCACGLTGWNRCTCDSAFLIKWNRRITDIEDRTGAVRIVLPDPVIG